jgi:antitoxin VapB
MWTACETCYSKDSSWEAVMIQLSGETLALARRLAVAQGLSMEDAIRHAIEQSAREAGIISQRQRRDLSSEAIAARKARLDEFADDIARMPVLDPRSPQEIMDDLNTP